VTPKPPVVLVHGFASSFDHGWARYGWPELFVDEGREVVPVELLGHGGQERPHDPAAYGDLPRHLLAQLPQGPVDAVGFSAGAITLLRLAVRQPERFRRLVLMGIGDTVFEPGDPSALVEVLAADEAPTGEDLPGVVFRRLADAEGNDRQALVAFLRGFGAVVDEAEVRGVPVPTLVVIGDRDPAGPADRLAAALADARLLVLPGVDHFSTPSDFRGIEATLAFLET
jgi:pimeloyl-ACP methyl ester carboxylesterase